MTYPADTDPEQLSGYSSKLVFESNDYVMVYQAKSEGYYSFKNFGPGRAYFFMEEGKNVATNTTLKDLTNGIPLPQDAPQIIYLKFNSTYLIWRENNGRSEEGEGKVSVTFYGRKMPHFTTQMKVVCPGGVFVSKNDEPPCENSASEIQIVEGDNITVDITCPATDGGTAYIEINSEGGMEEYLWHERHSDGVNFDIHCDEFAGGNGVIPEYVYGLAHPVYILNSYWLISEQEQQE